MDGGWSARLLSPGSACLQWGGLGWRPFLASPCHAPCTPRVFKVVSVTGVWWFYYKVPGGVHGGVPSGFMAPGLLQGRTTRRKLPAHFFQSCLCPTPLGGSSSLCSRIVHVTEALLLCLGGFSLWTSLWLWALCPRRRPLLHGGCPCLCVVPSSPHPRGRLSLGPPDLELRRCRLAAPGSGCSPTV